MQGMGPFNMERVSIFIDGNNFYYGLRKLFGPEKSLKRFDFKNFGDYLADDGKVSRIFYYNAQLDQKFDSKTFKSQKDFFTKLRKIPNFNLVLCKLLKRNVKGTDKVYYIIKEDDIHMAVDMVDGAANDSFDTAVVVSGDGDFVPAVKSVKRRGKKVINVYFKGSSSRNLKDHCDKSLELSKRLLEKFFN